MAEAEAPIIGGIVSSIEGNAFVRSPDGQVRRLEEGDTVKSGDVIITDPSSSVEIDCSAESPFIVPEDTEFLATEECFSFEGDASENEIADETIAAVGQTIESGGDILEALRDRGEEGPGFGLTGNNGHTFIRLGRIVLSLSEGSTTTEEELLAVLEDVLGQADLLEQLPALVSIIGEYTIVEGDTSGAFVVLLNQAPESVGSDITVTLNYSGVAQDGSDFNGVASVVIPAGSNATTFTIETIDDALAEGAETFTISIGAISDTNFVTIDADPDANSVTNTIVDEPNASPEDTALVSIAGEYTIIEGETSGDFTVSLNQAAEDVTSDITVALVYSGVADDGTDFTGVAEVTIAAGTNSATFSIDTIDDALAEGSESLVISIGEITDTNFEAIAADPDASSVTNAIVDETDPNSDNPPDTAYELRLFAVIETTNELEGEVFTSTEYVDALSIAEDGGVGTYVVLAVDENGDPLPEADQLGGTVTVNVGAIGDTADRAVDYDSAATVVATVGTTFTIAAIDDVFADNNEEFTLGLGEDWSRAGEFEGVVYSGTVTTTILDETNNDPEVPEDNDQITLNIAGPSSVIEGETTTDYTLSLVDADGNAIVAETDIVVTVTYTGTAEDGSDYTSETPITIAAGQSSATFDLATIDDAIADNGETIVLTISTDSDGGFEDLKLGNNEVTTTIIDDDIEPPIALDDAAETGVDASVVINVATNDSDPDGSLDLGSIVITQLPTNGSVVVNGDGTVTYTPNEGYVGPDTFQYTIADNDGAVSNVANVALQVSDGRETAAFTDNWVNGVEYYAFATEEDYLQGNDPVASGLTGDRLDENGDPIMGSFSWAEGEFVVFKIGDVIVAEFLAEQLTGDILFIHDIAGLALSNTNADQLENTAIFLQALDADLTDGDLSDGLSTNSTSNSEEAFTNGINISQEVRDAFVGYLDPATGEALDLQEAGKVMISNALAILGIEFTRQSEVDPNPNDEGGNENVFETQAIEHVTDTVLALADTEEAGERLADDFAFDAREEDIIVAGNGEITYSSELLDTEDGDPETARISFNAAGLVANATPQQVAIVENMEIEIPEGTEAQITLADGTTRVVGTVVYDDETREGYIQLEPFVAGDGITPDRGITNEEIVSGLLQNGGVSFEYTLWDWTASTTVSLDTLDTFKAALTIEYDNVIEGDVIQMTVTSSLVFETDQELTLRFSPEGAGPNFAEYADDFLVPLEYSTDGGATWQTMLQVDTYFAPPYDLPLPVFGFVLPAGSDEILIRIQTFDDVFDEDPEGPPAQVEIDGQLQGIELIDIAFSGDRFFSENSQPGIIDNDPPLNPYVKADFQIVTEDDGEAVFTITLYDQDGNVVVATEDVVISYETTDLGAVAGEDYEAVSGQVVIAAGTSSATVSVPIIDDEFIEIPDPEFAALTLTGISGNYFGEAVVIGDPQGSLRIYDNDQGVFAITDVQIVEGVGAVITVTRYGAGPQDSNQTVDISTVAPEEGVDSASVEDFVANSGTLVFEPGQSEATFVVATIDDAFVESDETFRVELSNPTGGADILEGIRDQIEDGGVATVTIIDNDALSFQIEGSRVTEGETVTFDVSLSSAQVVDVDVDLSFDLPGTLGSASEEDVDLASTVVSYIDENGDQQVISANADGTYSIPAGVVAFNVAVPSIDDVIAEGEESLQLTVSAMDDLFDASATGVSTIVDDEDTAYELRLFAVVQVEGTDESPEFEYVAANEIVEDGGVGTYVVLAVDENGDPLADAEQPGGTVTVNVGAGTDTADRGVDYDSAVTMVATVGTTFTIAAIDDVLADSGEIFTLALSEDWSRASEFEDVVYSGGVTTTIVDEAEPDAVTLNIAGPSSVFEGDATSPYTLSLVDDEGNAIVAETDIVVTVTYAGTAEDGSDYTSETPITISAGQSSATFDLATIDDAIADNGETIVLTISTADDGGFESLGVGTGTVTTTIIDDDIEPPVALDDAAETGVDASVVINVATNDSDPDGSLDLGSIVITQLPTNGSVVVNGDGTVTYTPNEGYVGPDTFQYTIADNDGAVSNVANVALQVSDGRETAAFTDNWVNGVEYYAFATEEDYLQGNDPVASGLTGDRLDENGDPIMGSFSWAEGEFVVFKIGDVIVAEFLAEQLTGDILFIHDIAGLALSNTNADQLENTAIFLQALDADLTDGDLSDGLSTNSTSNSEEAFTNGINISQEVRDAFVGYLDPTTGEALDLQEAGKVMISNALAFLGIEFTRQSEVDPNPNDEGGNENVFETQAIEHVMDTILALADTEEAGERLADDFAFDAREGDIIVAGNGEIAYSSEFLDTEDGNPETARISFNAAGLVANATPQQVAIVENMEIEIPEGTEAQITLADGTTRVVGTVVYDDETREGYIQLEPFVAGDGTTPDRGITNEEIVSGLLQSGGLSFVYTLWDWTASTTVALDTVDTYRNVISLEGPSEVAEGETTTEYTVSLSQPIPVAEDGGTDIVVTLTYTYRTAEEGDIVETVSVTIPAGSASATFTIDTVADDLAEGREDFVVSITEANIQDENFSVVEVSDANSVTTTIIDDGASFSLELFAVVQVEGTDENPEFDYVKASEIAEDGGVAEYVVLLVDAEGNPVLGQPGGTVTINVGVAGDTADREVDYDSAATIVATVGTSFTIPAIDDVVADNGEVFTLVLAEDWSLADANPAVSYENSPVSTTILDETDNDSVTISLGDLAVDEGSGNATITGSLDAVPDEEFVVTLDNGATITFGTDYVVGTEVESTPFSIQDDDVFIDSETSGLGVTSVTPDVFEAVNIDDTSLVVINDTIDTVTVDLSATETVAEDGTITYTATLTGGVANNDITVTLANGEVITIAAGDASGTVDVAAPTDDAYVTAAITNSIASAVEANAGTADALENLAVAGDTSVSTDVTENDTETAISLVDLAVDEGSGTASVTATIANAPTDGPVVVTLDNGATITFAVGATSATSTAFAIQGDDVYLDGETLTLNASVTSGGSEFENLTLDTSVAVVVSDTIDTVTVDLSATETVAEDGTITYTATLTGGVANNDITVTLANGEVITIAAGDASGTVDVAAPTDDAYVTAAITNSIASAVEANAGTADALENLAVAGDTSVSTDVTENDTETAISLVDLAVDEGSGTASVTATIANAPTDGPVVVTLDNGATITFAVGATSATSTAFAIQGDDVYLDGETLTLNASVTSGGSEFENLTLDTSVAVVVSDTIDTVTVDLSATETVAEDGTITYTATLTGGVANNDITVTLANGEVITIAAGDASGTVDVAAPTDDAYVTAAITNSIASAVEANAGTADALENLAVAGDTSVSTDVTENDTETAISLVDLAVDEGSGTASVTATIANAPTDGPVVVTLDNGATITFAVGATSATSTAFAIQGDDVYLDGETLTLNASVTSGGSEFENLTLDTSVAVVVSDTIDTVTVDLSATETVAEDGTITYTATLTGGVANNDITVTLANGEVITIAAGDASGTVDVAAPTDDAYVTAAITNSIASAVEANAGTADALENLAVAGDTSVSTDVTENDTETAISLVDLAVDEGSGTASVTATIANAPTDGPVVVTLDNGATITFAVGATSATSTAFAIQGDDVYLDGETLTLNASVTSGGSEFENLTLDTSVAVVVSDTIDTVTVDLSATETVAEDGTITYTATLTGGVANNDITVTLANGEVITIAAGDASGTVDVAAPTDDAYVTAAITNSIASAVEANAGTADALENLAVAGDTSVSTDVTENDTETAISLVDLAVDEGSGTASVTATIANAPTDGPVVVTLDNGATITFAVGATSATSTAFAIQGDDVYLDGETLTLNASVTSGGSEFENLTLDTSVAVVVSDTIDTVTVDLSATETVAEDGTITYTATLTGGVANNDITVTLANGEVITIAAGDASGTVDVAAPTDDAYVTAAITNSIASAVEANAGTADALENLAVAGDTSVSTDVTENDTETAISLVDLAVDEGSGTASVTATIANAPTDGPVVVTLDNGATITFAVGATSATSTAFAIQGDDVYLDGETLTLNASVTSGGSEFENLTLDTSVAVVVSDTIDTVTVDLSATETVAEDGTITYTATLTGGVANNDITVTLANGEVITIAAGDASGTVDVAAPTDDAYVTAAITNSIASAVEANAGTADALENLAVAGDTSVSTDVTENDTETAISLVDLAVDEGSGTASVTATIANAPTDGPVVVTLDNGATITFAVGATSATSTAFAIQGDDVYLDGETLTLNASVTSGGSEFENLTLDTSVAVVVSDTIDTVTVDLSATETVAEDGTITYTATLTGGVANNDITVTLANGEVITIAAGDASGTVDVAAPTDDAYVTAAITNSIASAVEANAGTADALENLAVAGDTSVSTDVTENDTETAISLVDLAVDEGSGTASVTATIANAPTDGPVVVTLDNGATITFAVGATSATSTAFAIQGDDVYLDGETLTLNASVTSGGSEFENLTLDTSVAVVVSDTIDTVTVDLSATETVAEDGTITYTATLTGGVANNDITVTLANGEVITIAAGDASGTVDVAAPTDDAYVTAAITNSIASAVEANAGTADALENLAVAGDTSVSTDVTENDTETAISLVDLAVDEGSGTASVTATIANAPTDGPVVVTLDNGATITFAVGATSATSTAFAIQGDDVYLDGETLTLNASVTSGGSEFENLTLDTSVAVVVSDTIDTVTVDLSATETVAEDGTITYTATLTGGVANNDITVTLANGEVITIAAGDASGTVDVAAPTDDAYVTAAITNSIASAVEANAGTADALENLAVAGDTSVSTDVTENDTETAISLVDLAVDEGSGTASVTATIANAPTDGPVVVTLDNGATITFAVGATSATSTAFAIQGDDVYLDGETLTLNASVTSGGSEFENLTLDTSVAVVVSDTIDTVTVDLSATETVAEDGTITYTATLTGGVANNDITVTLANGEVITIAAGDASGTVDVAAPTDDAYVTAAITNSIASAVEANAGTADALENLAVAGDTSVSTDVTENDTETAISLVDLAVDEGSGTASVTATIANAPTDGPVVVTLDNGATITFAVGATSATSTAFAIQGDDVYLDGETLTLNASVTSGGSEFENLTLDTSVAVVVSDTIDTVTVDLSATETVAEDGTITYTATLTGGVANNDITVTLANGEVITIAAGDASGTVDVAAPTDDAYVTAAITNSIASAVEANAGTADALENLAVAGDTSVSTDVTENDTETAISLVDLAVDEGSGTASVTATIANAPTDGPVVVTLDNGATITFAVGATSATSTAFAIQGDDVYLDGETLTLNASVTSGGSEFENLTLDTSVAVVVSDTIDTVTVDLSATETVAEDGTITYTATLTGGVANNDITVTLANGEVITIAAGDASGTVDVAAPTDDAYVTAAITNSIASAVEANAGTADALENLAVAGDTSVSTDVTENDTETAISLVDLAVDEGSGTASVTATIANAPTDGPVVVTLDNGATITFAVGATSATSTAFAIQGDDVYLDGETLTLNASVTSGGSEFENLTLDTSVAVVVSDTTDDTTLTLNDVTVSESDGGTATITASLDNAPDSDLVVTLSNGATITFAAGATTATSTAFAINNAEDVYVDGSSFELSVSSTSGGNFENLVTTDTSTVTVNDTTDTTTVTLVSSDVNEGADITIMASVDNAPQSSNLLLTLDNGEQILIIAGETTGSVTFTNPGSSGDTLTYAISNASGGNYEGLDTSDTVDVAITEPLSALASNVAVDEDVLTDGVADNESSTSQIRVSGGAGDIVSAVIDSQTSSNGVWTVSDSGLVTYTLGSAYSHDSGRGENTRESVDSVTVIVTDSDGNTARVTLGADITDAVSSATDDAVSVDSGSTVSGNVTTNDDFGADGRDSGSTGGVVFVGTSTSGTGGAGDPITGDYGTLTLNEDGTYTYVADGNQMSDVTDTFYYTIKDADGDESQAELVISISASDLSSSVDRDVTTYDAGLTSTAGTSIGTATVTATGGSGSYTYAFADGAVTEYAEGDFTIDSSTGVVTFTQDTAYSHATGSGTADDVYSIDVVITDSDGNTVTQTVNLDIWDDEPSATADTASVTEGASITGGDVLSNDDAGGDGFASSTVVGVGRSSGATGSVGSSVAGTYGTLTLNADGSYDYVSTAGTGGGVDTFYYTVTDADGDTSETTLTITVAATDLSSSVDRDVTTYDAGLTSTAGTSIGTATVTATGGSGSYTYAFADGAVTEYAEGDFTIDSSTGVVTFTQDTAYSHTTGSGTADDVYSIDVVITDSDGNTVTQTVNLDIWDDEPSSVDDAVSVDSGSTVSGNVTTNDDFGADGRDSGSTGGVVFVGTSTSGTGGAGDPITGDYGTLTLNEDGTYTYVADGNQMSDVTDTFYYTIKDADGDESQAELVISISASDLSSSVDRDVTTYDAGLTSTAGTSIGTATVTATGGSGSYTYAFADGAVTEYAEGDFTIDSSTGVVTFTQDTAYSHATGSGTADDVYSIDVVITDSDGNTVTQTVNLDIWDDEPSATADTASVTEGASITGGDVLSNDDAGGDGFASSTVVGVGRSSGATGSVGSSVAGTYGTLTLNADGSYDYVSTAGTGGGVDTFYYTVTDADGDTSETTLTITVAATDLSSSVDRDVTTYDAGLTSTAGTSIGTATVTATGGSGSYTYAFADGAVTEYAEGDFTIDSSTGVVTFTQDTAYSHTTGSGTADDVYSIDVVITDSDGNTVTQTVNLDIWDDEPSSVDDAVSVDSGSTVSGNVTTNDDFGADGRDSGSTGGVVFVGTSTSGTGGAGDPITGDYGTLTLNEDGTYTYVADGNQMSDVTDTFYYTIKDADGDESQAELVISISASDLSSSVDRDVTTYDAGLTSTAGTSIGTATVTATGGSGSYTYAFADGAVTEYAEGDFTIDSSTGVVTFTQDTAYSHATGSGTADDVYSIDVVITDSDGNTVTQTVNLDIWDDEPEFTSVTDGDNDGIVELYAPNVGATYSQQFADWNFGADGSGITTPSLSSVTGNISVVTASATQIVAQLLDDSGDVAAILTLNANGNDSLEVIEREPETVTVELLTSLAEPGGPVGSVEIATSEITVVVTGDNGDATPNDPSNDTVNTSNNGWGVQNQNLDPFESLTFDFGSSAVSDFQFDTTKFTGGGGSTRNLKVEVTYSDGSTDLFYVSSSQDATVHLSQLSGFDSTKEVSSVTVINDGPGSLNLNNITVDVESTDPVADLSFEFTLGAGAIEDADGDVASQVFNIALSGSSAGAFSSGSTAPVAIDLDGDGVEYLSRDDGVTFTDQESSEAVGTAWVASDDGLLVIDANDSGTVDSSSEYVFTEWSDTASSDLEAIAEVFDTNQDGVLDANDERFDQFAVWQDRDSDGITDADELTSLSDLGIESIELTYREDSASRIDGDGDVTVLGQANVNFEDGSTSTAEDVSFAVEAADLLSEEDDLAELLSGGDGDGGDGAASIRDNAAAIDTAQLELTLNFEHQESDSFDQHD